MADYRDISQEYARGAIGACILLNSGAAVAILSQLSNLLGTAPIVSKEALKFSMILWVAGATIGGLTWIIALVSTRYVDKAKMEPQLVSRHLGVSNGLMYLGVLSTIASFGLFLTGCVKLAHSVN